MSQYTIQFNRSAVRELARIPDPHKTRLFNAIEARADEPRPDGVRKLQGREDTYRIRVGSYRVLYMLDDGELVVAVIRVAHRQGAY